MIVVAAVAVLCAAVVALAIGLVAMSGRAKRAAAATATESAAKAEAVRAAEEARALAETAQNEATSAQQEAEAARIEADAARALADASRAEAEAQRVEAETQRVQTEARETAAAEAERLAVADAEAARADAAHQRAEAERLRAALDATVGERVGLLDTLQAAQAGGHDPATLWALEMARAERRWREAVAPTMDAVSPLSSAHDPARAVVEVEVAAVHEETGTTIKLDWQLPAGLSPSAALGAVRAAQEVLASGAKAAETATLSVSIAGPDILVVLAGIDDEGRTVELPGPVLPAGSNIQLTRGPGTVVARVAGVFELSDQPSPRT